MKNIKMIDIEPGIIKGVHVQMPLNESRYRERYFEWCSSTLIAPMKTNKITGGVLKAWCHTPVFTEVEYHVDVEMFYFISGTALMLFIDIKNGTPDMSTAQIARIKAGTQILISAGKGHFVPVAEGNEPVHIIVVSPSMDAPRIEIFEPIEGI